MLQIEKGIDKIVKTIRVLILDQPGYLGRVATAVGNAGGNITDTHLVSYGFEYNTRDLTVFLDDEAHLQTVLAEIGTVEGVIISEIIDPVLELHRGGKIRVKSRFPVDSLATIRKLYTPGVAKVCKLIEQKPELRYLYTSIGNTVAIVTNGTAILGLGDLGALASKPVMEGKAVLFKKFAGVDVFDIETEHLLPLVQVGDRGIHAQRPPAERDDCPHGVDDREDQAVAERRALHGTKPWKSGASCLPTPARSSIVNLRSTPLRWRPM